LQKIDPVRARRFADIFSHSHFFIKNFKKPAAAGKRDLSTKCCGVETRPSLDLDAIVFARIFAYRHGAAGGPQMRMSGMDIAEQVDDLCNDVSTPHNFFFG
jgi:hypothetical protein